MFISSNLPFSKCEGIFKDPMTTAAAFDRLVHHCVILELNIPKLPSRTGQESQTAKPRQSKTARENDCLMERQHRFPQPWKTLSRFPHFHRTIAAMLAQTHEEMSIPEIAKSLEITEEAVKMRFLRARLALRRNLYDRASATGSKAFQFLGDRCDRVTMSVLSRITEASGRTHLKRSLNRCVR